MIVVFFIVPLIWTAYISLYRWPLYGGDHTFLGLGNYLAAISDPVFHDDLRFTALFTVVMTVAGIAISFGLASLVRRPRPGSGLLRTAYFLPVTVGMAAAGYLWFSMYNVQVGVIDEALRRLHLIARPVDWLATPQLAFAAVVVMTLWKTVGFGMVIFLMGMNAIPAELYEAFRVDGATRWHTLRSLTVPLMRRSLGMVGVLSVVGSALSFDQFYTMTKGGPGGSMYTAVYAIYANAFTYQKLGYGSALAVILLVILLLISVLQLRLLRPQT
jgi:multiple sugar transport system permease protein